MTEPTPIRPGIKRTKPLRAQPRGKGNRAERAVIDMLHRLGWLSARRNFQSGGQGGGDIIEGPADHHIEVKHHEQWRLNDWIKQVHEPGQTRPTDTWTIVFRSNRTPWLVCLEAEEYFQLVADAQGIEPHPGRAA